MFRAPLSRQWLYILFVVALAGYICPLAVPCVRAEEEQEEPGVDPPPPPDEDEGVLGCTSMGTVPGDETGELTDATTSTTTLASSSISVSTIEATALDGWTVWEYHDYYILSPEGDTSLETSTKLMAIASAYQLTRPEVDEGSDEPIVLVVSSLEPVSAEWTVGWPTDTK